jgi:2-iminobutanoate/2-iminopropanoate deaminase
MASIDFVNPSTIHAPFGYSHMAEVKKGKIVFISGQIARDKKGDLVGKDDFTAQVRQAFENLKSAIESVGGTISDIVKLNYYVVDMSRLQDLRAVRDTFFRDKERMPASTLVGVTRLAFPDLLVEIEAVAVVDI